MHILFCYFKEGFSGHASLNGKDKKGEEDAGNPDEEGGHDVLHGQSLQTVLCPRLWRRKWKLWRKRERERERESEKERDIEGDKGRRVLNAKQTLCHASHRMYMSDILVSTFNIIK